jgi:pyrimidine operon attenuation protein/uracil phosphoribosyltransferase
LAHRIADAIAAPEEQRLPVEALDISLDRGDLSALAIYPIVRPTELP